MEDKEKQADTILNFIYTNDENEKLNKYIDSVELHYAKMTLYFKELNFFTINIELKENCFYYLEVLKIKTKQKTVIEAEYYIYPHKKNNIYIDVPKENQMNNNMKLISTQILYQSIDNILLPNFINYNSVKLNCFDTFKNTLRKRISLINIDANKLPLINEILEKYPDAFFEPDNSYEIYARIPKDGKIKYSGANLELTYCNKLKDNKIVFTKVEINKREVLKSLSCFKNDVFKSFINIKKLKQINEIQIIYNTIKDFYEKYKGLEYDALLYYDNILKYDNFVEDDVDIFIGMFFYLLFLQIFKRTIDSEAKKKIIKEKDDIIKEKKNEVIKDICIKKQIVIMKEEEEKQKNEKEKREGKKDEDKSLKNELLFEENGKKDNDDNDDEDDDDDDDEDDNDIQDDENDENYNDDEDNEEDEIMNILYSFKKFKKVYEKSIIKIKKLEINIIDKLSIIKAYNRIFIQAIISRTPISFIGTVNVAATKPTHAYIKAITFIRNIIEKLEEKSRLFEIFLYLDSDKIENIFINNEDKIDTINNHLGLEQRLEHKKNLTEFGLNMLNIDEIRVHLLNLLPKYIIRIHTNMKINATYDKDSKIMLLNELQLLKYDSSFLTKQFKNKKKNIKYVLPIVMEIFHEIYGHGKIRIIDEEAKTPEEFRDSKINFCRNSLKKKKDKNKIIDYSESGVVLENFISSNRTIIKWLKTVQTNRYAKMVLDINLWIDKDFNKLESLVAKVIGENNNHYENNSLYSIQTYSNDEDFIIDSDDDMCGFHKFDNEYNIIN